MKGIDNRGGTPATTGRALLVAGGLCALAGLAGYLIDMAVFMGETRNFTPGGSGAAAWFAALADNPGLALRDLGLINMAALILMIPVYAAAAFLHGRERAAVSALALAFGVAGAAAYISVNPALPLFGLGEKFLATQDEVRRSALVAAGEALLARGEDFTVGAFPAFLLGELAMLTLSLQMSGSRAFGRVAPFLGLLGSLILIATTFAMTFTPAIATSAMYLSAIGGLASMAWYGFVAFHLLRPRKGPVTA